MKKNVKIESQASHTEGSLYKKLEELISQYDGFLKGDEERDLDEYEQGEHDQLLIVNATMKEILHQYRPDAQSSADGAGHKLMRKSSNTR